MVCHCTTTTETTVNVSRHHILDTSVDVKHHGPSLSERWNVTWVGNNSMYILNHNSPNYVCSATLRTGIPGLLVSDIGM